MGSGMRRPSLDLGLAAGLVALVLGLLGGTAVLAAPASADTSPPAGIPATVSADPLPTWQVNGVVWAAVTVGTTVYATGSFTKARPAGVAAGGPGEVTASNIFAFDITTGNRVTAFSHSLNAQGLAITASPDGSTVFVGGDFTTVDGVTRNRIAAFTTATNALSTTFVPSSSGQVHALAATDTTVYAGGGFGSISGTARTRLAAINSSTGAVTSWSASANAGVTALVVSPDGSRLIAGGHFTTLNGTSAYGLGAVSTSTGATQPWAANTVIRDAGDNGAITTLRTDGTLIYGAGYAFGRGATFEGTFAAQPNTGTIVWLDDCHGDTYDVRPSGPVLYSVGHPHDCSAIHDFPDTSPRVWHRALAETTAVTGTNSGPDVYGWNFDGQPASSVLHWFPELAAGSYTGQTQAAWAITGNSTYLVLGGEFPTVNGTPQQGLVRFAVPSVAPDKVVPLSNSALLPKASAQGGGQVKVSWTTTWDYDNQNLTYKLLRDGVTLVSTQSAASSFWQLSGLTYTDTGLAVGSRHSYKITVTDPNGNIRYTGAGNTVTVS
jgi:hypothetical protein